MPSPFAVDCDDAAKTVSSPVTQHPSRKARAAARRHAGVNSTGLGSAVVPEVKTATQGSSAKSERSCHGTALVAAHPSRRNHSSYVNKGAELPPSPRNSCCPPGTTRSFGRQCSTAAVTVDLGCAVSSTMSRTPAPEHASNMGMRSKPPPAKNAIASPRRTSNWRRRATDRRAAPRRSPNVMERCVLWSVNARRSALCRSRTEKRSCGASTAAPASRSVSNSASCMIDFAPGSACADGATEPYPNVYSEYKSGLLFRGDRERCFILSEFVNRGRATAKLFARL